MQPYLLPGAGPNAHIGVVCVHGFTGNPGEVRPLGEFLAGQGYTVNGVLLPGHGGLPADLRGVPWSRWTERVGDAVRELRKACDRVFLAGLSMGGLASLHLGVSDQQIAGVITLGAPADIADTRARWVRYLRFVVPWYGALDNADFSNYGIQQFVLRQVPDGTQIDFSDPRQVNEIKRAARVPLDAVDQLLKLNERVMEELPQLRTPVLFMQGRLDGVVASGSVDALAARCGSPDKQVRWWPNSGHVLTLEPDSADVFRAAAEFIASRA